MTDIFSRAPAGPRYVSHRGFQPMAPENSLPGFDYAGLLGQWAIETDVHLTRDGMLVCCHDAAVDAMYDGVGQISELTWAELSRLRICTGSRLGCFEDEQLRMPRLHEYLAICRRHDSVPFIELKAAEPGRVLSEAARCGFAGSEIVMSASRLDWLEEARTHDPHVFLHHIFGDAASEGRLAELGNAGLSWKVSDPRAVRAEQVDHVHDLGLRLCLRAADSAEAVRLMGALGLDYLPTNLMHGAQADMRSRAATASGSQPESHRCARQASLS